MTKRTTSRVATAAALALMLVTATHCASGSADYAAAVKQDEDERVAPEFTLSDIDGNEFSLSDSQGKVRLIDFWATWCAPCREEIPMLNELARTYGEQGLTLVAISDEDREVISEFAAEEGIEYRTLVDSGDVAMEYSVLGLPTAFLIDADGRILKHYTGPKPRKVLEADIREALALPPAT